MVEDISGEMEFFLNEKLDLKVFDIINIQGYKGRRFPSTDQITVYNYDQLLDKIKTSGKYKPEKTVALVREERFNTDKPESPEPQDTASPQDKASSTTLDQSDKPTEGPP
jgi:hypothetical protein